ncbi:hypothetical protein DKX38_016744 [Salix brachista]|uniref:THH1/TOM1/TOM3 domain-containing protein n=1 Tax=Salix brachista TaxID=2182728 RepID=A0A5N5KU45_9ROSI|nr:hypothetical protein DKX38_016744 [Salix brachista]
MRAHRIATIRDHGGPMTVLALLFARIWKMDGPDLRIELGVKGKLIDPGGIEPTQLEFGLWGIVTNRQLKTTKSDDHALSSGSLLGALLFRLQKTVWLKNSHAKLTTTPLYSVGRRILELWSATGGKISTTPLNGKTGFSTLFVLLTLLFPPLLWFIQLIRIELRVPEYGWTTQKVFHFMNFIVNGGISFAIIGFAWTSLLLYLYTPCSVLGRDISSGKLYIRVARSLPSDKLRVFYISVNAAMYFIQVCIWVYLWIDDNSVVELIGKIFIAVVSILAALSFLAYGGRLFFMLRRFPIESKGRRKKLHEVWWDQLHPFASLASLSDVLCLQVLLSAFDADASLDVLDHPVLNFIYYMLVEILPSALVLFILRKLPPKRISAQYHSIC